MHGICLWLCTAIGFVGVVGSTFAAASATALPTPAERQFAAGLRLAAANKNDAAIAIFSRLTSDYPRLLEPHVQLAALYIKQGKLSAAIVVLHSALELRTENARLQEQLGDVYLQLAAQAYGAAIDAGNAHGSIKEKYSAVRALSPAMPVPQ